MIDCGGLANPVNGVVDLSNGTTLGSVARYSCGDIYELVGEATRNCTLQDTWSGEAPTCRRKCVEVASNRKSQTYRLNSATSKCVEVRWKVANVQK